MEFISGGVIIFYYFIILYYTIKQAKQYAMMFNDKISGQKSYVLKLRGITLDYKSCKKFQYEQFKSMVLNYGNNKEPVIFNYDRILPQRDSKIISNKVDKKFLPICQKGIIDDDFNVLPFGYE